MKMCDTDETMDELAKKFAHRKRLSQEKIPPTFIKYTPKNVYSEFPEFTRKQIQEYEQIFKKYDTDGSGDIDQVELQIMMEKLGSPQTYLGLKQIIKEADEDYDGQISFREFLLIFRKAASGKIRKMSGLHSIAKLSQIDVHKEGVGGARSFFEAKIREATSVDKWEAELKQEQEEKRKEEEAHQKRKAALQQKARMFGNLGASVDHDLPTVPEK